MAMVTVRVVPRSGRQEVRDEPGVGLTIHVRAAPERGKATEEAARLLAAHLGVSPTSVRLRTGARSRTKVFEVRDQPRTPL
jgi:uncharacterized protein YggU (UPF0235/DUF167 family)